VIAENLSAIADIPPAIAGRSFSIADGSKAIAEGSFPIAEARSSSAGGSKASAEMKKSSAEGSRSIAEGLPPIADESEAIVRKSSAIAFDLSAIDYLVQSIGCGLPWIAGPASPIGAASYAFCSVPRSIAGAMAWIAAAPAAIVHACPRIARLASAIAEDKTLCRMGPCSKSSTRRIMPTSPLPTQKKPIALLRSASTAVGVGRFIMHPKI
jgi:hypothetical protein